MQAIILVPFSLKLIFPCILILQCFKKPHNVVVFFKVCYTYFTFFFFTNVHIFVGKFFVFC